MPKTYEPIQRQTAGASVSSIVFTSIPQNYTDLILICNYAFTGTTNILGQFNGDTGTNYSWTYLEGYSTTVTSGRGNNSASANLGYSNANQPSEAIIQFANYSNSTTFKTSIARQTQYITNNYASLTAGLWRNTNAITSINVFCGSGTITAGSLFTLYGIKAA